MRTGLFSDAAVLLRRILRERRGAIAITVALSLPLMLGFTALGVETGLWYAEKTQSQTAADAAALTAAYAVAGGTDTTCASTTGACRTLAKQDATINGANITTTVGPPCDATTISGNEICVKPFTGPGAASANGAEVFLAQQRNTILAGVFSALQGFSKSTITMVTHAVAIVGPFGGNACALTLNTNPLVNNNIDIQVSGNSNVSAPDCTLVADSSGPTAINLHDSADRLTAYSLSTPGQIGYKGDTASPPPSPQYTLSTPPLTGSNYVADPYQSLTHAVLTSGMPGTCTYGGSGPTMPSGNFALTAPARLCPATSGPTKGEVDLKNQTVTLSPGTYWVTDGDLVMDSNSNIVCPGCSVPGPGVTIILTTATGTTVGTMSMNANETMGPLNAPNSGTFAGFVLIQDPNNPGSSGSYCWAGTGTTLDATNSWAGGASATLNGIVYVPCGNFTYQGNPSTFPVADQCLIIVANTVSLQGTAGTTLFAGGCLNDNINPPKNPAAVLVD